MENIIGYSKWGIPAYELGDINGAKFEDLKPYFKPAEVKEGHSGVVHGVVEHPNFPDTYEQMSNFLKMSGVKNNLFPIAVDNIQSLVNNRCFNIPPDQWKYYYNERNSEAVTNIFFLMRNFLRNRTEGGDDKYPIELNPIMMSVLYALVNSDADIYVKTVQGSGLTTLAMVYSLYIGMTPDEFYESYYGNSPADRKYAKVRYENMLANITDPRLIYELQRANAKRVSEGKKIAFHDNDNMLSLNSYTEDFEHKIFKDNTRCITFQSNDRKAKITDAVLTRYGMDYKTLFDSPELKMNKIILNFNIDTCGITETNKHKIKQCLSLNADQYEKCFR